MSNELATLQEQYESLKVAAQVVALKETLRRHKLASNQLTEGWGDCIDPFDSWKSEASYFGGGGVSSGGSYISRAEDRSDGDNAPHFDNEHTVAMIRGACEWLATTDTTAIGMLEALTSYIVGWGSEYSTEAESPEWEPLAQAVECVIDEFLKRERWCGGLDAELFQRTRRAGERFVRIVGDPSGFSRTYIYEPAWITEPASPRQVEQWYGLPCLDWKYGIASAIGEPTEIWGYFGLRNGDPARGEFIPAEEMSHVKINVDRNVKRGLSDFYAGREWLNKAAKVLERVLDGAAIQASIALIRKYLPKTKQAAIDGAADSLVQFDTPIPSRGGTTRQVPTEHWFSGKIVDQKGVDFELGPMGQSNAPTFLDVADAGNLKAGRRYGMHKTIITGDATAETYASSLVAESPFTKFCQRAQAVNGDDDREVLWIVVGNACRAGRIPYPLEQVKQFVKINVEPPDVAARDPKIMHDIRQGQHDAGILSKETWADQEGIDFEQELARGAKETIKPGFDPVTGAPLLDPNKQPQLSAPVTESVSPRTEALAARALSFLVEGANASSSGQLIEHCGANADGGGGFQPGNTCQKRAKSGGEIGPNGEHYKGGAFIATTEMPKKLRIRRDNAAKQGVLVEPGKRSVPEPGKLSIWGATGTFADARTLEVNDQAIAFYGHDRDEMASLIGKYKSGERFVSVEDYPHLAKFDDMARMAKANYPIPADSLKMMAKARGTDLETLIADLGVKLK